MNKRFGKNDVIFILFLLVFCIGVCAWVYFGASEKGSKISITIDGKEHGSYSLAEDQTIVIDENHYENTIVIKDGKAYMKDANCPDQLCVHQKQISFDNESIICLPNKVVITVESDIESDVDGILR